ncbi:beta-1,3-galactosyltransferase 1 [Elysia marginata]|uniref:Hexosyltransferase n=1 Tax=Elysia marginata TaxID=1093978 RepID=A0AAV4FIA7_9GAST|nr:beta-1,3-galactosyltransferase 1 [Elysia marginata]
MFKPRSTRQQSVVDNYLVSPWAVCAPDTRCPYLLAVQLSVAGDVERRQAVRSTWGSVAKTQAWPHANINGGVQLLFVLARPHTTTPVSHTPKHWASLNPDQQWSLVRTESDLHGDLLYLDMLDSYFNLTLKLMSAFQWVRDHCDSVKFVLKVDTDTFVNVPLLLDLLILNEHRLQYSVTGYVYSQERTVHRRGKWAVNQTRYPPPIYPVYASGTSYIFASDLLQFFSSY